MKIMRDNGWMVVERDGVFNRFVDMQELWDFACEIAQYVQLEQFSRWMSKIQKKSKVPDIFLEAFKGE